jgi:gliding motility-associated-like protein
MKKAIFTSFRLSLLIILSLFLNPSRSFASHILGADFYYTWVSGYTYNFTVVIYGDCSGSAFHYLSTSTPQVNIYNGGTAVDSFFLSVQAPSSGVEVTPVCDAYKDSTTCRSGNIPGITKFVYSGQRTLSGTSANWKFFFNGNMGGVSAAGRSAAITNIAANTLTGLIATLNNVNAPNSSATYTTIPTPFFCLNEPASYNPGAVDPNGDSLAFGLVPAIDATFGSTTTVLYNTTGYTYSATNPLHVTSGTLTFSYTTGQLNFLPDIKQQSIVVERDSEFRNGTLVGTSMREMNVIVLNCNNPPPSGKISSNTAGTIIDSTDIKVCQSDGSFTFHVDPTSPDSAKMSVTAAGLPAGSTYTITGNGTKTPKGTFSWNVTSVTPGTYTFFLTFQDSACPLSSKQTEAYTVAVLANPRLSFSLVSGATCVKKAVFDLTPSGAGSWTLKAFQGTTTIFSFTGVTATKRDSLSPGTYTFRVINANGCYKDTTITIAQPPSIYPTLSYTLPTCVGDSDGSITITGTNGVAPYTYAIGTGAYSSTNTFTNLKSGSYTLHVQDANYCIKDTNIFFPDPAPIHATVLFTKPPCNHFNTGSIAITATNSTGPYLYALGSGSFSSTNVYTGLYSGPYIVHIKNANGCQFDTTVILPDSVKISANLTLTNILCHSDSTGAISVSASGAFGPPYTYQLNTGTFGSSNTFSNLPAGTFSVHVQDSEYCHFDTTVTLTQPLALALSHTTVNVDCYSNATGSITENVSGGTPSYTYNISGGVYGSTNLFTGLIAGTYVIGVKDNNGCIKMDTVTVTQPNLLVLDSVRLVNPSCNGTSDGTATAFSRGGTTPYTYAADAGSFGSSSTLTGLANGAHTIHVMDAHGCVKDTTITLIQPTPIVPSASVTKSVCKTLSNGIVTLSATGGTGPYTYANGTGTYSSTATFTPLAAGSYTFHIKDAHGCIKDTTIAIIDSFRVAETSFMQPANCYNDPSGYVVLYPTGGTSPYTYANGTGTYQSNDTIKNLLAGTYTLHVKDANGCINDTTVTVIQPTNILPAVINASPQCYAGSDGSLTLSASGGTPPYTFANGTGSYGATGVFSGLKAGTYTLHVQDNHGCIHDTTVTITQPTPLNYDSIIISEVKCFGDSSGFITVYASGGTPSYMYAANSKPYQGSDLLTTLKAGASIIHLKDNHGCIHDTTITLTQPTLLTPVIDNIVEPTCQGYADGSVAMHGTGGTPSYTYSIDGGTYGSSGSFTTLLEGPHVFRVKDANGCIHDTTIKLIGYPHIVIQNSVITNPSCYKFKNGSITFNVTGGVTPLSYRITGSLPPDYKTDTSAAGTTSAWTDLVDGQYTVMITDSKGCFKDTTLQMIQPAEMLLTTTIGPNDCEGADNSGLVTVNATGGTPPYAYLWSTNPPETTASVSGLQNALYTVWVNDTHNCKDSIAALVAYDDCCKPFVPDAFTPNDDGLNDLFRVRFKGDMILLRLSVYDRFGTEVFHTNNIQQGWDGKWNGVPQPLGVYFYYIKAICGNKGDHVMQLKGDVTLIR